MAGAAWAGSDRREHPVVRQTVGQAAHQRKEAGPATAPAAMSNEEAIGEIAVAQDRRDDLGV